MRTSGVFDPAEILPEEKEILKHQGIPKDHSPSSRIRDILSEAVSLFLSDAKPQWIRYEVSTNEFKAIYGGPDENSPDNPLDKIYPMASHLAIFALTAGWEISNKVENIFEQNDYAMAAMLDSVVSTAAENAVTICEDLFQEVACPSKTKGPRCAVLAYSPGYCGWHIRGQKKLFEKLKPGQIGITLNNSFLMTPLKSVSGVLVAGPPEIHLFKNNFDFCNACIDKSCTERMWKLNHPEKIKSATRSSNGITKADFRQSTAG